MLDQLTLQQFEALLDQTFTVTLPEGGTTAFTVVDVAEFPAPRQRGRRSAPETIRRTPFSVFFKGTPLIPQGSYPMQHDAFGSQPLTIFIVPISEADGGGYEYEAVFT